MQSRFIELAPKFQYYLGVTVAAAFLISPLILGNDLTVNSEYYTLKITIITLWSVYAMYVAYNNISKSIYAVIDVSSQRINYGNVFFNQESDILNVVYIRRLRLKRQRHLIAINGKEYFVTTSSSSVDVQTIINDHQQNSSANSN